MKNGLIKVLLDYFITYILIEEVNGCNKKFWRYYNSIVYTLIQNKLNRIY